MRLEPYDVWRRRQRREAVFAWCMAVTILAVSVGVAYLFALGGVI